MVFHACVHPDCLCALPCNQYGGNSATENAFYFTTHNRGSFNFAFGIEILLRGVQTSRLPIILCMCVSALIIITIRFLDYYVKRLFFVL